MSSQIQQAGTLSGRSMTMMVVIGLHALAITALVTWRMAPDWIDPGPGTMAWSIIKDPVPPPPPIANIRLRDNPGAIALRPGEIPRPDVVIDLPLPDNTESGIETRADPGPSVPDGPVETVPVQTALRYQMVRPTEDYYPNASLVQAEHGVAVVRVCVDANGSIAALPSIETSSGYRRLDEAAIRWARESLRFTPATRDGVAIPACKGFRVNFNLR